MTSTNKIFVALAIAVAAFYFLETGLTLSRQGFVLPVLTKGAIALLALFYAVYTIAKKRAPPSIGPK